LPETEDADDATRWCETRLGVRPDRTHALAPVRHGFTHFELEIRPLCLTLDGTRCVMAGEGWLWYNPRSPARIGLAAVVERLLGSLEPPPGGEGLVAPDPEIQEIDP
jgi:A/G-specific adenine glycosylase